MQTLIAVQKFRSWARRVGLLMLAFLGLTGCTPLDEPGFTLVLGSDRVLVGLSGSTSIAITLLRSASFTAPVHIDVEGVPAGVHAYVWPNPVPGDRGHLNLYVSSFATPGRYRLTVVAQSETFLRRQQVSLEISPRGFLLLSTTGCPDPGSCSVPYALVAIDVWSGEQRIVAHLDERSVWPCLAVDPTTNLLYAAGANRRREQIVTIDAHSGAIRVAATLDRPVMALAFSPQGNAYVILPRLFESGAGMTLCTVDLAAGSVQEIARIQGVDSISGLAFGPDGRLWAVARKKEPDAGPFIISLDPTTGGILSSYRTKSMVSDIACTPDGVIFGTDGPYLVYVSQDGYTHHIGKGEVGALWGLAVIRVD